MKTVWILVADEGVARVLAPQGDNARLEEVEKVTDAGAHADNADLRRDAYGRRGQAPVQGDAGHPGAHAGRTATVVSSAGEDALHQEAQLFSRRVAKLLEDARNRQRFDELVVIAPPRFLGLLRQALPASVSDAITREIGKDYCQLDNRTLQQRLADDGIVPARRDARVPTGQGGGNAIDSLPMR
ncbi:MULTISPECIES: host attachment protein [Cupriavidus]|uniref:Host attachment protein n=1 Tax=Cupriavidus pauculus TaxID=82633 RepID=A0A3G8H6D0_9BURK|nr:MULTISPECIES: host attachment protein [Cupriavidus]AZG15948.1 host attachment protein [Cupriavidus pauculus]MDT6964148.1 host attachment protein [Cupriavidus sp. SZY C1]